jgi:hypothetical protein
MKPKNQDHDWRFWAAVMVVSIVLYVGLRAFHRFTQLGSSLSLDGLAMIGTTLVAAATGFLAILYQVRSSSRQLREQMADQHLAATLESERQKRAIAKALLFEVDDFYASHLSKVYDHYRNFDGKIEKLPGVVEVDIRMFAVYNGNTPLLGKLPDETVKSVVTFYDTARAHLLKVRDYKTLLREYQYGTRSPEAGQEALQLFFYVRADIPRLTRLSYETCLTLARLCDVPFRKDVVAVAGEDTERLERDQQTEASRFKGRQSLDQN